MRDLAKAQSPSIQSICLRDIDFIYYVQMTPHINLNSSKPTKVACKNSSLENVISGPS